MSSSHELRRRILHTASDKYLKEGFFRITMDDIANASGVSKKTIYQYFDSKDILLQEVLNAIRQEGEKLLIEIMNDSSLNFANKIKEILVTFSKHFSKFSSLFINDMQKVLAPSWQKIMEFKNTTVMEYAHSLIQQGIDSGFIKPKYNVKFLAHVLITLFTNIVQPSIIMDLSMSLDEVFDNIILMILEGVMTTDAKSKYNVALD